MIAVVMHEGGRVAVGDSRLVINVYSCWRDAFTSSQRSTLFTYAMMLGHRSGREGKLMNPLDVLGNFSFLFVW